jgi:hypothetical protein
MRERIVHVLRNGCLCSEESERRNLRPLFEVGERVAAEVVDPIWTRISARVERISCIKTHHGLYMTNYTLTDKRGARHVVSEYGLLNANPKPPHPDYLDLLSTSRVIVSEGESMTGPDFEEQYPRMEERRPWWKRMKQQAEEAQDDDTLSAREGEDKRGRGQE